MNPRLSLTLLLALANTAFATDTKPYAKDLHFNAAGYDLLGRQVADFIAPVLK